MATLSLKISLDDGKVTKTMQFDPSTSAFDACKIIREKISDSNSVDAFKDCGLFLSSDEDNKKGIWLESGRSLEYYILRNGDVVEFKKKMRTLRVRMLDGTLKTMMVDDSQNVANLMVVICTKIGITNYDEYSLVREDVKDELDNIDNKPMYGTLTLKRKHAEKERDAKMELLRKKLKTDDEINWIDPSKTLREQGVDEQEIVLLKRKFFYSDQNIDSRDPVQLNLLYVQARDAILDGTHPVTIDKACEFAGIQCQIQFGDHKEDKHTTGFLDLKEFLPQSYMKIKTVEKKVFKEHKRHIGLSELDSKVIYTKTARALRTYGVAFFLVKEKMKGRNKLVPRLLGVTKDSVLRLDEKTKEILQTWPLTTVRRWCASPNTFTLDFGDYSDQYYSVQTTEAEQILQVIAGYIDIILKKQKAKDHFGIEGDEGSTMVEDSVAPLKATILQHETSKFDKVNTESLAKPAIMRAGPEGVKPYSQGHMGSAQYTTVSGQVNVGHAPPMIQQTKVSSVMSEPQKALLSTISSGQEVIKQTERQLVRAQIPELGSDPASIKWKEVTLDTNKQNVSYQIAAMNAATAQVVTLTSGPTDEVDHNAVGAAITTIASNLPEVSKRVQMIAALMDDNDNGDRLLDATRHLCSAFSDLLKAAEPETKEPRQNLLNAASRVGEASTQVLHTIGEDTEENREIQDMLLALAKAVANTTAALVLKAKNIAATCKDDQQAQNRVIGAATQCALATSQLVACAKVVAPTLSNPACREQVGGAAKQVSMAVQKLVNECEKVTPPSSPALGDLATAAADVSRALDDLLNHVNTDHKHVKETIHETSVESIMTATDRLCSSSGNTIEMVRQARLLGQATAQLIQNIKLEAEKQPDSETQRRLLAAAKLLADATAKMVEAARQCANSPYDKSKQELLCRAAEEIKYVTTDYASSAPDVKRQLFTKLAMVAKQAASNGTQLIGSVQNAGAHNTNKHSQDTLVQECRILADHIPRLIEGVKDASVHPDDSNAQLDLINASEAFLQPGAHAAQAARAVLPTVQDQASALHLNKTTQQLISSCSDLRNAVGRARSSCTGLELDAAAEIIRSLQRELYEVDEAAREFRLKPLPGETAEAASQDLTAASRTVGGSVARLISAAQQGSHEYAGRAAQDTAQALRSFAGAARGLVASAPATRVNVIDSTQNVMSQSLMLVEEAKRCLYSPNSVDITKLTTIVKNVSLALDHSVNSLPGHQDVDITIETINETLQILSMGDFPSTNKSYGQLQQELNQAAAGLTAAATDTVQAVESPAQLGDTSKQFGRAFNELLGVSMEMAGQTTDYNVQNQMVISMKNVSVESSKLLTTAKSVSNDPSQPNSKNKLSAAARAVTDSINYLVDVCTSAAPGQKECDSAVRSIQSVRPMLQHPSEPVNELGYFQCVETIIDQTNTLGDGISGMANLAKISDHEQFAKSVKTVSESVCGLIECTAQAAYLIGVSDPTSKAGRPGLVDQTQFARASQAIQQACTNLVNPASNEQQVLSAATHIAKHTSALCNACRVASSKTTNPVAKRHFVQSAKDVANSTAALVKEIKALDSNYSEANRSKCAAATDPLLDAVNNLCQFANSPEFVSVPAKISTQARRAQEPILESGRKIIQASCSMIESSKYLAVEPNDKSQWHSLATHSRTVSDSIKSLVNNIKDKAPGQSECLAALDILNSQMKEVDNASLQAVAQNLSARKGNSLQGYTEQMESSATEMLDKLEPIRAAAKFEAENLGHSVNQMISYVEPLVTAAIGTASNMVDTKQQHSILDQSKTVVEGCIQLILAAKEAGGNPRATVAHSDVDEYCQSVRDAAGDLMTSAENLSAQRGIVSGLLDSLTRSVTRITDHRMSLMSFNESDSFVDYQTRMVGAAKEIARLATEMMAKSGSDVSKLATLAGDLTHRYNQLAQDSIGAAATTTNNDIAQKIRSTVVELGQSVINLVNAGGICQVSKDSSAQRQVTDGSKQVSERVGAVLSALQAGSKGTQACIDAAARVAAIIGDLDTTILFASAGTLHADNENDAFADYRELILKTAKALVEDTKTLVGGAASSQEQLATAAQNAIATIVQLSEVVKQGAMSLGSGNPDSQVMLIHAVRDVAAALKDLIQATKDASGKHIGDPAMARLKDSAKVMVTNVSSLLKTVKAVEDEHTRGTRALEATIEAIAQEIRLLLAPGAPKLTATPEELVRCTKAITVATAKAVAAGNSAKQDDVIAAANIGRRAIGDMLTICKGAAYKCAETEELRSRTLKAGHNAANTYRELLQAVLKAVQGQVSVRQTFPDHGRNVALAAAEIVAVAESLKGTDWVDPDDPTVIAENELLGAAASIDAAANKLAALRPRKCVKEADETLNFDEMILEAAKSIIAATSALVKAASAAQRELIDQGKVARRPLHSSDDGQWSEGLVSAARLTAAAAHSLAESANALVQGLGSEERLVSAAKQVAGSTAQLLVACKVKADPNSESTRRLQSAGNAVIKSTDNLVRAAQKAISHEEERCLVLNRRMVGGIAQEINARSEVLRIERQLDEARGRLTAIRQAKYKLKGGDTSGDDTDNEITLAGYPHNDSRTSPYNTYSGTLNSTRQDGGYTSDSSAHGRNASSFNQSSTFGQFNSFNQSNSSFNKSNEYIPASPNRINQEYSTVNKSTLYSSNVEKNIKYPSPPPPNPPPPMTTNLSTFTRSISTGKSNDSELMSKPVQNYEGFTTRSANTSNTDYETRCFESPRSLNIAPDFYNKTEEQQQHKSINESSAFSSYSNTKAQKYESPRIASSLEKSKPLGSPLSPKFNAKFDLKREFESSDLSHNNYSQNILSTTHDTKTEYAKKSDVASPTSYLYGMKSPTSPKPFAADNKIDSYSQPKVTDQSPFSTLGSNHSSNLGYKSPQYNTGGYSETNQAFSFRSDVSNKKNQPSTDVSKVSPKSPNNESVHIFGKESYSYGAPNFSQETMTEVKEIPNGTQKITTTKIYSSTPMKITSTNMKYDTSGIVQPQYDSMNDFNREFGKSSGFNTLDSNFSHDTMKSFTSQASTDSRSGPTFLRPSDFQQSDFPPGLTVSKAPRSPSDLAKELDAMERKLLKQTISSEVVEKKTVMTTSSKSESSSTTMKKFGNF